MDGEFQAIYVLRAAQRRGGGRGLMVAMAGDLVGRGFQRAALWVLEGNQPARAFYAALGGLVVARREDKRPEGILEEVAYGWSSLASVVTAGP